MLGCQRARCRVCQPGLSEQKGQEQTGWWKWHKARGCWWEESCELGGEDWGGGCREDLGAGCGGRTQVLVWREDLESDGRIQNLMGGCGGRTRILVWREDSGVGGRTRFDVEGGPLILEKYLGSGGRKICGLGLEGRRGVWRGDSEFAYRGRTSVSVKGGLAPHRHLQVESLVSAPPVRASPCSQLPLVL